ncbi:hypothetical protein HO924_11100 [Streptococcus suis]|nr:hypothetical protein [Streptococcus suis]
MESNIILPVITPAQEELILSQKNETYEQKLVILNKAYGLHIMPTNSFTFKSEENIKNFIDAVLNEKWEVDSGLRFINITEHIGIANFLYCKRDKNGQLILEGKESDFKTVMYENATLFTEEEIKTAIPEFYAHPTMVLTEKVAKERWGYIEDEAPSDIQVHIGIKEPEGRSEHQIEQKTEDEVSDVEEIDHVKETLQILAETDQIFKQAPGEGASSQHQDKKVKASIKPR